MHRLQKLCLAGTTYLNACIRSIVHANDHSRYRPDPSPLYVVLLIATLLCGAVFYLGYRGDYLQWILSQTAMPGLLYDILPSVMFPALPLPVFHSLPSLIGGLSVVLFVGVLHPASRSIWLVTLAGSITTLLVFEVALGYFHWLDVMTTLLGVFIGLSIVYSARKRSVRARNIQHTGDALVCSASELTTISTRQTLFPVTAAVVFSSLLAVGSTWDSDNFSSECARYHEDGYCEEYKQAAQPVYMSYNTLRNAVRVEAPRAPDRIGRLYLYGNYVFLNEVNEGIHIIDNTEPTSPVNLGFIRIPGNTELAVRDNYLYADSYVDLLTLDINNPLNATVIGREQLIFPYDEYQNIPQNISLTDAVVDRDRGVVVSYRLNGS